ncbi:hypothetical protein MP638_005565 [Amoeboaphelidium occidentale]|nr:hypothetical protein MP638_005565 [Amoeboaphelidium occidentale]
MIAQYAIALLSMFSWSCCCLEYLWSTRIDGDPNWGVYQIQPLSCNVTSDGNVHMIVSYNSNPSYVYNANSNDVAATLTINQGQSSANAFLSFAANGTLLMAIKLDFVGSGSSSYYWIDNFVYMMFGTYCSSYKNLRLDIETGQVLTRPFYDDLYNIFLTAMTIVERDIYYQLGVSDRGYSAILYNLNPLSSKSKFLLLQGGWSGNRVSVKDKKVNEVLFHTNGTYHWSITGSMLLRTEIQDDGSVYFVSSASTAPFTINLNRGGSNVTHFTTYVGHDCIQVRSDGFMESVYIQNVNGTILRNTAGVTSLIDGRYVKSQITAINQISEILYDHDGLQISDTKIYYCKNCSYLPIPLAFVGNAGIIAFTGSFKGSMSVYGTNASDVKATIKSNGYDPKFLVVYDLFNMSGGVPGRTSQTSSTSLKSSTSSAGKTSSGTITSSSVTNDGTTSDAGSSMSESSSSNLDTTQSNYHPYSTLMTEANSSYLKTI